MTSTSMLALSSSSASSINMSSNAEDSTYFSGSTPFWMGARHLKSGDTAYLAVNEWTLAGRIADFVICEFTSVPRDFKEFCEKAAESVAAPSEDQVSVYTCMLPKFKDALPGRAEKVQRISVNFHTSLAGPMPNGQIEMPYKLWTSAMLTTAAILKRIFPSLIPVESNFNVHMKPYSYSVNSILFSDAEDSVIVFQNR